MSTRYTFLSAGQKLALTNEELQKAIELEAAERGIQIPIQFSELLKRCEYKGFQIPPDAMCFYEVMVGTGYNTSKSGLCFQTEEEALNAIKGAFSIYEDGYGETRRNKISDKEITICKTWVTSSKASSFRTFLKEYEEDLSPFDDLAKELMEDLSDIRQKAYNKQVNAEKKAKYLSLADDNEEIAKRFWNNIERCDWPEE
jgi:hypothetical protein